jgi:fructokinase
VPGTAAKVLSTVGAGDALTGVLLAALSVGDLDPSAVPAALPDAVAESARACERWGALD